MVDIEKANAYVVEQMMEARPVLTGVGKALDIIPGMHTNLLLHAGPPVIWERMAGPMKGAMVGALIFEGRAKDWDEAEGLLSSGKVTFEPCHHHASVGPMAGPTITAIPNSAIAVPCSSGGKVWRKMACSVG